MCPPERNQSAEQSQQGMIELRADDGRLYGVIDAAEQTLLFRKGNRSALFDLRATLERGCAVTIDLPAQMCYINK